MSKKVYYDVAIDHTNGILKPEQKLDRRTPFLEYINTSKFENLNNANGYAARFGKTHGITTTVTTENDLYLNKDEVLVVTTYDPNQYILLIVRDLGATVGLPSFGWFKLSNMRIDWSDPKNNHINPVLQGLPQASSQPTVTVGGRSIQYDVFDTLRHAYHCARGLILQNDYTAIAIINTNSFDLCKMATDGKMRLKPDYVLPSQRKPMSRLLHPLVGNNAWSIRESADYMAYRLGLNDNMATIHHAKYNELDIFKQDGTESAYSVSSVHKRKAYTKKGWKENFTLF